MHVRPSAVAGSFYPSAAADLSHTVSALLADAPALAGPTLPAPKALIVPHAGYIYSGATAALAYAQLTSVRTVIRRVILLGPAHRVAVRGLALAGAERFATPLGMVDVDLKRCRRHSRLEASQRQPGRPRVGAFARGAAALPASRVG